MIIRLEADIGAKSAFLGAVWLLCLLLALAGCTRDEPRPLPGKPYHHIEGGFRNPEGSKTQAATITDFLAFLARWSQRQAVTELPTGHALPIPQAVRDMEASDGQDSLTWLGHAAFLIRLGATTILTDPFLTGYASPLPPLGPKRFVPSGIPIDKLPPIDLILLSHNHYDHLDVNTLDRIPNKDSITAIVPLGLAPYFEERGYGAVHEVDWFEAISFGELTVTGLPAHHFSRRGLFDRNATLWAGFAIEGPGGRRLYFGGDTAYGPSFARIRRRYGAVDVALIPIGAYEPRIIMEAGHANPEEAVQIGLDLGAKTLVGMHWGTIVLTDEPPFEPGTRFRKAANAANFPPGDIWIMKVGETRPLPPISRPRVSQTQSD